MQAIFGAEGRHLALAQFVSAEDLAGMASASRCWSFGGRIWASILWRDFSEEPSEHTSSKEHYRRVRHWRSNAELPIDSITKLPDADATLAYMARKSYYPLEVKEPTSEEENDPYYEPETKNDADVLRAACRLNLVDSLRALMAKGLNMTAPVGSYGGWQPLHMACSFGHLDMVKLLITEVEGLDINARAGADMTPLLLASAANNVDIVRYLVTSCDGVDTTARSTNGETALCLACEKGALEVVRFLVVDVGVDVNAPDKFRKTPLYKASFGGKVPVVRYLLTVDGIDVNAADQHGSTAHSIATRYAEGRGSEGGYSEIMSVLESVEGFRREASDYPGSARARGRGRGGGRAGR